MEAMEVRMLKEKMKFEEFSEEDYTRIKGGFALPEDNQSKEDKEGK